MRISVVWLALAGLLALPGRSGAATILYSTGFEAAEGYDPTFELIGQAGWVGDTSSTNGGNGLLTNYLGSQAAYVGSSPLEPATDYLGVFHPLNYSPLASGTPVVKFSVTMTVVDSTNGKRDDFYWSVYNIQGHRLFTVDFFNGDLGIYYVLDDTNGLVYTGTTFTNDGVYTLAVTMNFGGTNWSATLNGAPVVTAQPLTTTRAALTLGDIDAAWFIADTNAPGDNFMVFDNYLVTVEPVEAARLVALGRPANGQFPLQLTGPSGARYAIDASVDLRQWSAQKTNTITDGSFDYVDTSAASFSKRFYRARLVP
ncbi:MAG TPA: hypothetical protein VN578_19345 [Candidatus Binatia bacterium]|jgi:hypothetical protein|nr:hypothetical protein [Candidatus Binatia bacterium]